MEKLIKFAAGYVMTELQENPVIGMLSSIIAFGISIIDKTTPLIQWASMIVFFLIGIVTAILKVIELIEKIKGKNDTN